jgi:hypothetical protein
MSEKIYYGEDGKRLEAKGEKLEYILQTQTEMKEAEKLFEAAEKEKAEKKESAVSKLKAIGLTDDEIAALIP